MQARGNCLKVVWAKNSGSLETEPCVLAQGGGSAGGVTPEKFLQIMSKSAFWGISWPKWLAKLHAVVDMRLGKIFSRDSIYML